MVDRVDKSLVGREVKLLVSDKDFLVQYRIDLNAIVFYELAGSFIVSLALDALNLGEQSAES